MNTFEYIWLVTLSIDIDPQFRSRASLIIKRIDFKKKIKQSYDGRGRL